MVLVEKSLEEMLKEIENRKTVLEASLRPVKLKEPILGFTEEDEIEIDGYFLQDIVDYMRSGKIGKILGGVVTSSRKMEIPKRTQISLEENKFYNAIIDVVGEALHVAFNNGNRRDLNMGVKLKIYSGIKGYCMEVIYEGDGISNERNVEDNRPSMSDVLEMQRSPFEIAYQQESKAVTVSIFGNEDVSEQIV